MRRRIEGHFRSDRSAIKLSFGVTTEGHFRHSQCSKERNHRVLDDDRATEVGLFGDEHEAFADGVRLKVAVIATHRNKESGGSLKYHR